MAKKPKRQKAKKGLIITAAVLLIAVLTGVGGLVYNSNMARYSRAVGNIEEGDFKAGYDALIKIAENDKDYKDTCELLYTRALELIETGDLKNKQAAYKMLTPITGYKYADEVMYYLWVEDVYDPEDDNTFEQAQGFIDMIAEDYDGPYADEVKAFREDIKKSMEELMRKKYEAATGDEFDIE